MAKDPAFLFYPGDWLGGTMGMSLEQKGAYLELLIFQFNNGKFTEAQAKQVLSICFASVWEVVSIKFKSNGNFFWNERLEQEIEKRKKFSESRRMNAKGHKNKEFKSNYAKAYAKHMENENENENEIKEKKISSDFENWVEWGNQIVSQLDPYWVNRRNISREEMDAFISVAIRNTWRMETQQQFRDVLKGFDWKGLKNSKLHKLHDLK